MTISIDYIEDFYLTIFAIAIKSICFAAFSPSFASPVMRQSRLKSAAAAETAEPEKAAKIIKNDELIKFAGFVSSLCEKESETKPATDEREEIKFVLDEQVKKWAQ